MSAADGIMATIRHGVAVRGWLRIKGWARWNRLRTASEGDARTEQQICGCLR